MATNDYNLFQHFRAGTASRGETPVLLTDDGTALTFSDLDARSAQIARYLARLGLRAGNRVSAQVRKSPESLCLYLACLRAGFVFHPLNPAYKAAELGFFLTDAEPSAIVCDGADEATMRDLGTKAGCATVLTLNADGGGSLAAAALGEDQDFDDLACHSDQLAALLYSSGTTGTPKGIMLTHGNLLANTEALVQAWGFSSADRLLHALPIFHVHGLFVATGCVLLSGADMVWLPVFDVDRVVDSLPLCTVMMGVPTFYTRLLASDAFTPETCRNMRLFVSGSAPLLVETFVEFEQRTGHRILERYGMTETNMNTSNPLEGERKPGTVGPPLPGVEVRVVDADGKSLPPNETGDLQVRGPNVFAGYWRLPEKTAEDFTSDGYFNTGDLASIDDDGYVAIVGRARDLVISGGLNVYPKEVEVVIDGIPGIRESAVIGVPHADFGEGVVAVVVRDGSATISAADVITACKRDLADFKVPKRVVFVDELPRNTMAKVQKSRLRDDYSTLFA